MILRSISTLPSLGASQYVSGTMRFNVVFVFDVSPKHFYRLSVSAPVIGSVTFSE